MASTEPQAEGHAAPLTDHRIALSGWPELERVTAKPCLAPSSTLAVPGDTSKPMSLATVTCALALLDGEAALVAVTRTVGGEGKSAGAVNKPLLSIVPDALLPPVIPLTLQVTVELVVPAVLAENCSDFPSKTFPLAGAIETVMVGGGSGLRPELATPPPQPAKGAKADNVQNSQPFAVDRCRNDRLFCFDGFRILLANAVERPANPACYSGRRSKRFWLDTADNCICFSLLQIRRVGQMNSKEQVPNGSH